MKVTSISLFLCLLLFSSYTTCQPEDIEHNNAIIAKFPYDKACAISFTFDDNCPSCQSQIVPIFNEFGFKATFFVITDQVKDWGIWKNFSDQGFEIGNHTSAHLILGNVYDSAILNHQINDSYDVIADKIGQPPLSFAHPGHSTNARVDSVVFQKHLFSRFSPKNFCSWHGWTSATSEGLIRREICNSINLNRWYVPAAHGVGDCWEPLSKEKLTNILRYIKENEHSIVVETFKNIALYKTEKKHTTLRVENRVNKKIIKLVSNLSSEIYNYPLTLLIKNYNFPGDFSVSSPNNGLIKIIYNQGDMQMIVKPDAEIEIRWQ